jgi:RNA polymerase sigma-70 factor (ECF subfamily)
VGPSDWELVRRARKGERQAFRQLVERYQRKMAGLAVGMLRDPDDALDVVQEAFAKAYQSLNRFKDDSVGGDPLRGAQDAEIREHIERAMAELTPEHRAVILLREVEGLSYDEISQALDCPKGTVMSRLHYARRQLQHKLRELL